MSQTPSHRRREGREAFYPGGDPGELCPYRDQGKRQDFFEGWKEALTDHEQPPDPPTYGEIVEHLTNRLDEMEERIASLEAEVFFLKNRIEELEL